MWKSGKPSKSCEDVLEQIADVFVILDKEYRYVYLNSAMEKLFHRKREDLLGKTVWEAFPEALQASTYPLFSKAIEEERAISFDDYYPPLGLWIEVRIFPSSENISILIHDVTERKRIEEALRDKEWFLEKSQEVAGIGSWISDLGQTGVLRWSKEVYRIFDIDEGEFDGRIETFFKFVHPDDREAVIKTGLDAQAGIHPWAMEHRIIRRDGTVRWLYEAGDVQCDENGNPTKMIGIVQDITDRKLAEEREREREQDKLEFYRRTIMAATNGKLMICEPGEIKSVAGTTLATWRVSNPDDIAFIRNEVLALARSAGLDNDRVDKLAVSSTEAITNAIKHAGGGTASLHRADDALFFVISDQGPGIPALTLPEVALRERFSTAGTLGMGYKIIIAFSDRVYLATGPEGTTVGIWMKIHPTESQALEEGMMAL